MKIKAPIGYARLTMTKEAGRYATSRLEEGCKVHIKKDGEGLYRVEFEPDEENEAFDVLSRARGSLEDMR